MRRAVSAACSSTISTKAASIAASPCCAASAITFCRHICPSSERRKDQPLRRARAPVSAVPARPLRGIQSGLRSWHLVRPAVARPHRVDSDVHAAAGSLGLRLASGSGIARGAAVRGFSAAESLPRRTRWALTASARPPGLPRIPSRRSPLVRSRRPTFPRRATGRGVARPPSE